MINPSFKNWINNNKKLVRGYRGKWIAYNEQGILASAKDLDELFAIIEENDLKGYVLAHIHRYMFPENKRILPVRLRSVQVHDWQPMYPVKIIDDNRAEELNFLVDSGADISLIPHKIGEKLGLYLADREVPHRADGIGGSISYVMRYLDYQIDEHILRNVPTGWIQDKDIDDIILGRDVIFDAFDITFKQADETIIFEPRYDFL